MSLILTNKLKLFHIDFFHRVFMGISLIHFRTALSDHIRFVFQGLLNLHILVKDGVSLESFWPHGICNIIQTCESHAVCLFWCVILISSANWTKWFEKVGSLK